jgi:hypothetical protein
MLKLALGRQVAVSKRARKTDLAGGGQWIRTLGPSRLILGEEKGRRSIRVVANDAVPFHGGTSSSNPSCSTGASVALGLFAAEGAGAAIASL